MTQHLQCDCKRLAVLTPQDQSFGHCQRTVVCAFLVLGNHTATVVSQSLDMHTTLKSLAWSLAQ